MKTMWAPWRMDYILTEKDENCIFCEIVKGDSPASIVFEDQICVVFMDIQPVNHGHALVIPKVHAASLSELAPDIGGYSALHKRSEVAARCDAKGSICSWRTGRQPGKKFFTSTCM